MSELLEDGRIVKGVNTTPDVDVNSISREAGKFGNKVDKDGKPPTLSKKVKGASTNVLYNLGLAEDVIMKESYKAWFKDKFGGDPEYKAWRRMYKNDPKKAKYTFGSKHKQFLATYVQAGNEKRFTAMEWACIEGGHDISDLYEKEPVPKPAGDLFTQLENFADGKKKGKSRPGRVKKSGASCNGSVTALRKRAKNASGEKAKMYHWCANMKSGKKK